MTDRGELGPSSDDMLRASYDAWGRPDRAVTDAPPDYDPWTGAPDEEEGHEGPVRRPMAHPHPDDEAFAAPPVRADTPPPPPVAIPTQRTWAPPEEPPATASPERRAGWIVRQAVGVGIGVLLWFGYGWLFGGTHIDDLVAGDCFQEPSNTENVTSVDEVSCAEPHDYEVFAVLEHPAGRSEPFPGEFTLLDWSEPGCYEAFGAYVGTPYEDSIFYMDLAIPTEEAWDEGDRGTTCVLYRTSDEGFTVVRAPGSARSSFQ